MGGGGEAAKNNHVFHIIGKHEKFMTKGSKDLSNINFTYVFCERCLDVEKVRKKTTICLTFLYSSTLCNMH